MKILLEYRHTNPQHTRVGVFINSAYCGELTLVTADVGSFDLIIRSGLTLPTDKFLSRGHVWSDDPESPADTH